MIRPCVAVTCKCGGWVMLAVLNAPGGDRATWREVAKHAADGFTVRSPLTVEECLEMEMCEHRGNCTTDPEKMRVEQLELAP